MDFSIGLASGPDSWKAAVRAEELGFTHAWFYDSQLLYMDVFVSMALAAERTSRIRLGTGVLIPTNRIAPVTAAAFGSLNRLAPGRIDFGVGTGFTGRNTMGLPPMKLDDMKEYCRVVQALLRGETVEWETEGYRRKIRFLVPELELINTRDPVPLHVSAFGPRGRQYAADEADGWITFIGARDSAGQAKQMDESVTESGRKTPLYKTAFAVGAVLEEGEAYDGDRAMAQAGPLAATRWHAMMDRGADTTGMEGATGYRALYESYEPEDARYLSVHKGHFLYVRDDEREFVTADMIAGTTFTGTASQLRERVEELESQGWDQFSIQLMHGHESAIEDWSKVFGLG